MKKYLLPSILALILIYSPASPAATIYLNDGQVMNGAIVKEDDKELTIETKYQKKTVPKNYIKKIDYHRMKLEPVRIVTANDELINGFLVSQEAERIVYKKTQESPDEITLDKKSVKSIIIGTPPTDTVYVMTRDSNIIHGELVYQDPKKLILKTDEKKGKEDVILKEDIKRISYDMILVSDYEVILTGGMGYPMNSGGANLGMAPSYFAGIMTNGPFLKNMRLLLEAGYSRPTGKDNENVSLQMFPATLNLMYRIPVKRVDLYPRLGAGASMMFYKNSYGESFFGTKLEAIAGLGASYQIKSWPVYLKGFINYAMIFDEGATLKNLFVSIGAGYKFSN
jgi:hypothetical protein